MSIDACKVCGKPLYEHHVVLLWGVAHAAVRRENGTWDSCSERSSDYYHIAGRLAARETIVRSLRWHAGRLRTKNAEWLAHDLDRYADKIARDIDKLIRATRDYYAWAKEK